MFVVLYSSGHEQVQTLFGVPQLDLQKHVLHDYVSLPKVMTTELHHACDGRTIVNVRRLEKDISFQECTSFA